MRIGVLTGGGDVPGLNPCIKAITQRATELGWDVVGFRRGWAGPGRPGPGSVQTGLPRLGRPSLAWPSPGQTLLSLDLPPSNLPQRPIC